MNVSKTLLLLAFLVFFTSSCSSLKKRGPSSHTTTKHYSPSKKDAQLRTNIVSFAKKQVGAKYKYAGKGPKVFDCSGFTHYTFDEFNIAVSPGSRNQAVLGKKIPLQKTQKGDLIFFGSRGKVSHVALVVNNNSKGIEVVHSTSSKGVIVQNISTSTYWKPRILFARDIISK